MPDNPFACVAYNCRGQPQPREKDKRSIHGTVRQQRRSKREYRYLRGTVQHHRGVQPGTDLAARRIHPEMKETKVQNDPCAGTCDREGHCPSDCTKPRAGDDLLSFRRNLAGFVIAGVGRLHFSACAKSSACTAHRKRSKRISGLRSAYSGEFWANRSPANSGRIPGTGFSGSSVSKRPVLLSSNLTGI